MSGETKIAIKIDEKVVDHKRQIFFDEALSHHADEEEIQNLLETARNNFWKSDENDGVEVGKRLYRLLNGSGGRLKTLLQSAYDCGAPLYLYLDIPFEINALPFELLCNQHFLLLDEQTESHLVRRVSERNRLHRATCEKRPLKVLFMASSPLNLPAGSVLQFEKEEEDILRHAKKYAIDLLVEDSGSLEGLHDTLYENDGTDIVHLSGHAGIDLKSGPVFYLENETGTLDKITPERLWEEGLKDHPPRILFLSGCSTGKSDKLNASESFAHRMVEKGIPIVLGWGLPVSDVGASRFTAELYKYLAMGKGLGEAVQRARLRMKDIYHPWPLLRLFSDGSALQPLVAGGKKQPKTPKRKLSHKQLADSQVRVLESGFIGRRRQIQEGMRILKGLADFNGLLIHGPAGIGKSCLAGKLIERCPSKELIVIHGKLEKIDLITKLRRLFDRLGLKSGLETLNSANLEFDEKIKTLFRNAFKEQPTLLYFDDFEQNLLRRGDVYVLNDDALPIIKLFLEALDWCEGLSNVVITSRYPFVLEHDGTDLPAEKLCHISLLSFRDADLEKKKAALEHLARSPHVALFTKYGAGNPRLMEWMEQVAILSEKETYDVARLEVALAGKSADYIHQYLADILAECGGADFQRFLHQAAVFRQPAPAEAFAGFGSQAFLEKGVRLTLFEREKPRGHAALYWVMPVIREGEWEKLTDTEQKEMHGLAYLYYEKKISEQKKADYKDLEEAVYHALSSDQIRKACNHAIDLGKLMDQHLFYREKVQLQESVSHRLSDSMILEAVQEKNGNIGVLFNELGLAWGTMGDAQKSIEFYNKALKIDLAIYGGKYPNLPIYYSNLGLAWKRLGNTQKAINFYNKALKIDLAIYGEEHPRVATSYNNLGVAWKTLGDGQKAINFYNKALKIDLAIYGEEHPQVAISYNNLGAAWDMLGDAKKAIDFLNKALKIDLPIYGEEHPKIATRYNNLGAAWNTLGDAKKARDFYNKALKIYLAIYGEEHPNVAIDYNNLGEAWDTLGDAQKAMDFYNKSLDIFRSVYGEAHPHTKIVKSNLDALKSNAS